MDENKCLPFPRVNQTMSTDNGNERVDQNDDKESSITDDLESSNEEAPLNDEEDTVKEGLERVAVGHSTINRLLLPTAILILSILYIENTLGRISWENLRYPYFVIGLMLIFTVWVYIDEVLELLRLDRDMSFFESIRMWVEEWKLSITFGLLTIFYIWLIDFIGFYSASFVGMTAIMYVAGVRDYKLMGIIPIAIIIVIYIVFEVIVLLRPPRGLIDSLILF